MKDANIWVSLEDLASAVEEWKLTAEDGNIILEAEGYTVVIMEEDQGTLILVDGNEIALEEDDLLAQMEGTPVSLHFLNKTLNADTEWDEEENTLLIHTISREAANAAD